MEKVLQDFKSRLLAENEKQNLISRKTAPEEVDRHIEDSRVFLRLVHPAEEPLVDIGSGAGFPGLIIGLVSRETPVTLLESDLKKSGFLQETAAELEASNIQVVRERAEVLGQNPDYRGQFAICTSRAVASIRIMVEYALPLLKVGGALYLWKGPKYQEELSEAENALQVLGGTFEKAFSYDLPGSETRVLVKIVKTAETPEKYPRKNGIPAKRPL